MTDTWVSPNDSLAFRATKKSERLESYKPHILDSRVRRIGIDVDALQKEIEEKKQREASYQARRDAFDSEVLSQQKTLLELDEKERLTRRRIGEADNEYRREVQKKEYQREYDIWRPDKLKVSQPARLGDNDENLGPASGQVFEGEDLKMRERLATQALQRQQWFDEQIAIKNEQKRQQNISDLEQHLIELETQALITQKMDETQQTQAAIRRQLAEDNLILAQQKKSRELEWSQKNDLQNDYQLRDNERTDVIYEKMFPRGVGPMEYRGMRLEEQRAILEEQKRQMHENERKREEERQKEEDWNQYQAYLRAQGDIAEAEYLKKQSEKLVDLSEYRKKQKQEHDEKEFQRNKVVYGTNDPDDYYYNQWGRWVR